MSTLWFLSWFQVLPCIFIFIIPLAVTAGFQVTWKNGHFLEGLVKAEKMKSPWRKPLNFKVNPDETSGSCILYLYPLGTADDCRQWLLPRWQRADSFSLTRNRTGNALTFAVLPPVKLGTVAWSCRAMQECTPKETVLASVWPWEEFTAGRQWYPAGCALSRRGGCLGEACPLVRRMRTEQHPDWQGFGASPAEVAQCAGWR